MSDEPGWLRPAEPPARLGRRHVWPEDPFWSGHCCHSGFFKIAVAFAAPPTQTMDSIVRVSLFPINTRNDIGLQNEQMVQVPPAPGTREMTPAMLLSAIRKQWPSFKLVDDACITVARNGHRRLRRLDARAARARRQAHKTITSRSTSSRCRQSSRRRKSRARCSSSRHGRITSTPTACRYLNPHQIKPPYERLQTATGRRLSRRPRFSSPSRALRTITRCRSCSARAQSASGLSRMHPRGPRRRPMRRSATCWRMPSAVSLST